LCRLGWPLQLVLLGPSFYLEFGMGNKERNMRQREHYRKQTGGLSPKQWPYNMTLEEKTLYSDRTIKTQQDFVYNR